MVQEEQTLSAEPEPTVDDKGRKFISLEELGKHKTKDDVWMTIHNKVYNVTKYLDEHPGGEEVLMDRAGQNATMDYEDVGHSKDARKQLDKFEIGELPPSERSKDEAGSADAAAGGGGLMLAIPVLLAAVGAGYYFYFSEQ